MKFLGYYFYTNTNIQGDFQICISVPLRIIPRLIHSSEIQLLQTICFKTTRKQTNKDYKEELKDVPCFLNKTSAVGHRVVVIPDYFYSTFHLPVFSHVLLELLSRTSNSKNVLFIQNRFKIIICSKCEIHKIHKTQTIFCSFYRKVFIRTSANFL